MRTGNLNDSNSNSMIKKRVWLMVIGVFILQEAAGVRHGRHNGAGEGELPTAPLPPSQTGNGHLIAIAQ